jgi:hypothetical protein
MTDEPKTWEFDVTVTVKKRVHFSGPKTIEDARAILRQALDGGMAIGTFAKRGIDGHPIETVLSENVVIGDVTEPKV